MCLSLTSYIQCSVTYFYFFHIYSTIFMCCHHKSNYNECWHLSILNYGMPNIYQSLKKIVILQFCTNLAFSRKIAIFHKFCLGAQFLRKFQQICDLAELIRQILSEWVRCVGFRWPKTTIVGKFWHFGGSCTDLLPMRAKFGVLEQIQGLHLQAKFHLNVFIVPASGGQKPQFSANFDIFGGSLAPFYRWGPNLVSYSRPTVHIYLRNFVSIGLFCRPVAAKNPNFCRFCHFLDFDI